MENLVLCPCGHALTTHDYAGCSGDRGRRCVCPHDRHAALEAAVESARLAPILTPGYGSRSDDAA